MTTLPELSRKLSNRIEKQKGTQLSAQELNLLVECGAFETLTKAAADAHREMVSQLADERAQDSRKNLPSDERAKRALARTQKILNNDY